MDKSKEGTTVKGKTKPEDDGSDSSHNDEEGYAEKMKKKLEARKVIIRQRK